MKLSCALLLALLGSALAYTSYDGYQVLRTREIPAEVLPLLAPLTKDPRYDFWTAPRAGRHALVMAAPENVELLRDTLHRMRLNPTTYIPDVGVTVRREREANEAVRRTEKRDPKAASYDRFMDFDEIMTFMHEVISANPSIASMIDLGMTTEGRILHGIKISSGSGRRSVWIDCVIHAREWLAAPICMRVIEEVVADPELQGLVDWHILPVANPDGYSFTWTDTRLWRKTRRPNPGTSCIGTDPNRNFDYNWNGGNDNNPCAEDYPGDRVWSEPECASIGSYIDNLASSGQLALYVAFHSYGELLLYPWGDTLEPAPTQPELHSAGVEAANIIASFYGTRYTVQQSIELYPTYGVTHDYAYSRGADYGYTFELPGGGLWGFNPAPSAILPTVTETTPGLYSIVRTAAGAAKK